MKNSDYIVLSCTMFLVIILSSCAPSPKDIHYGDDICQYCKMTIVDTRHAAESVTDKGKVYMYDAIECLVNMLEDNENQEWAFLLVNDYSNPSALINAENSYFLISQNIPSPMGAFLSAFKDLESAEKMRDQKGGMLYDWQELKDFLNDDLTQSNEYLK